MTKVHRSKSESVERPLSTPSPTNKTAPFNVKSKIKKDTQLKK